MATANQVECEPAPGCSISLDYDDVSLLILAIRYQNLTSKNARITLTVSGVADNEILNANTQPTTRDVSAHNWHMVNVTPPKGDPTVGLPSNIQVNCAWPA